MDNFTSSDTLENIVRERVKNKERSKVIGDKIRELAVTSAKACENKETIKMLLLFIRLFIKPNIEVTSYKQEDLISNIIYRDIYDKLISLLPKETLIDIFKDIK
jgi:dGTP triphosphohydrolase